MFPRPPIDLAIDPPDVNELGRWPLTVAEHPALEPHFAIASALADAGVTWTELCARGAQHRHLSSERELVDYLDAWCSVTTSDYAAAVEKLGHVRHAPNASLVRALKFDVAALAAAHGSAHDLESFLRNGGFLDVDQVDLVAAAYFEVGKLDDAAEANQLAEVMDNAPTETVRCTRLLRGIADTANGARGGEIAHLKLVAFPPTDGVRAPHCREQYNLMTCWKDLDCNGYWSDLVPSANAHAVQNLGHVYQQWNQFHFYMEWYSAADDLSIARPLHDRYRLLVPAIDLALRSSNCSTEAFSGIDNVARRALADLEASRPVLGSTPELIAAEADRKNELAKLTGAEIERFRTRLEATRSTAKRLDSLDRVACMKALAALPPVQP